MYDKIHYKLKKKKKRCGVYIYTMEYYSGLKNEIGSFVVMWLNLESVI